MAERTCETCGAKNDVNARFCWNCDSYLGWDVGGSTLDGEALTGTVPQVVGTVSAEPAAPKDPAAAGGAPAPAADPGAFTVATSGAVTEPRVTLPSDSVPGTGAPLAGTVGTAGAASAGRAPTDSASTQHRDSPTVSVATPEVVVTPDAPGEVELEIENMTNIVDGYVFEAVDAPAWLDLGQPDVHLMPAESRTVALSLGMRQETMVVAQRFTLTVVARSVEDEERRTAVRVVVTVPPHGPRMALEAHPTLIRLEDTGSGSFSVRLDNRGANYPQTVGMSGEDSEGVVKFAFTPEVAEVPAGAMVEVAVTFATPQPAPGQQVNRQLTVSATNDEGPVVATVTLVQSTAAAPIDAPITLQLQPSTIRLVDAHDAEFEVLVDNRGGHSGVTVTLAGHDPEQRLAFAFVPARFVAVPGHITRANGRLRADPPPPGTSATHPFTVVASDGTTDVEASAVLEVTSSASAIATAELRASPQKLDIGRHREGDFGIEVDNRRGVRPLNVAFTGRSDDGIVRATFSPPQVAVAPGAVGHTRMSVSSPHPAAGKAAVHRLEIVASDGAQSLTASAELAQTGPDRRRPTSRWLVFVGAILVAVGALLLPWFVGVAVDFGRIGLLFDPSVWQSGVGVFATAVVLAEAPLRILLAVLAAAMLFGMAGQAGGLTRKSALLVVLLTVAFLIALAVSFGLPDLAFGLLVIWIGAVLGYIGGVLARPRD